MALTVKDILELPSGKRMQLIAGKKGLSRPVISVEIADYEFAPEVAFAPGAEFDLEEDMEAGSFIITSFLFAKDDPSLILTALQKLEEMGMAGLAFKQIIYEELPEEALAFAEEKQFPLFSFNKSVWFENIIFDIMYAVQFDDKVYLSEEKIDSMLSGNMNRSELDIILKGISLKLRQFITVNYVTGNMDVGRVLRSFYMLKGFHSKGLMVRYGDGLFLITTSQHSDQKAHDLIRREAFELLGIPDDILLGVSDVHKTGEMDKAFRESWYCCAASAAEGRVFARFGETGIYRVLLPAIGNDETAAFSKSITSSIEDHSDLYETVEEYVGAGGDIARAAAALHCHQNTVRYRLGKVRELCGLQDLTDSELFMQLKVAFAIRKAAERM